MNSFRRKYTYEKLKSIQISAYNIYTNLVNNISNNSNDNSDKLDKNIFCKSFGSTNIVKSFDSINSLNLNNNYIGISKSGTNHMDNKINEKEDNKINEKKAFKIIK